MRQVLKKLAGQAAVYGISSVLGRLLNILLTPIFTNKLAIGAFGIVSYFYSYIAFANVFLTFGMETALFRFSEDHKDSDKAYHQAFIWVYLLVAGFWVLGFPLSNLIARLMDYPDKVDIVRLVMLIIGFDVMAALPLARLRQQEKAKLFAGINLFNIVLTLFLNIWFIYVQGITDITYIFAVNVAASGIRWLMALVSGFPRGLKVDKQLMQELAGYGFYIMLAGLAGTMNEVLDRILIPKLWENGSIFNGVPRTGEELNGIYAACYKMGIFIALVTQAFRYAAEPFFFRTAKDKDSPETFSVVFHYFLIACLMGFLVISSFALEIMSFNFWGLTGDKTFIGKDYWEGVEVVPILLLAYVCSAAYINLSIWFKITKQTRFAILFAGTGALISIILNVILIPSIGYIGSAWTTLISYGFMCVMVYVIGQKYYPIPYRMGRLLLYAGICLIGFLLNHQIGPINGYGLAAVSKVFICSVAVGLIGLGEYFFPVFDRQLFRRS
ncbi:MAG: oligosaccharide flippase family protein [Bacteroidota bacterium]